MITLARFITLFALALSSSVVGAAQPHQQPCLGVEPNDIDNNDVELQQALAKAIILGKPFQPSEKQIKAISRIVTPNEPNAVKDAIILNKKPVNAYVVDNLKYCKYVYLGENIYVLHPMSLGRYILDNASGEKINDISKAAIDIGVRLPNGGLAWYYPKLYPLNRMLGPDLHYSGISQGTLLSGFLAVGLKNPQIGMQPARDTFTAMLFPWNEGGICLEGKAILEMPSYHSAPEIILNGWLDALLHLAEYAEITGDEKAEVFLEDNVKFLVEILPVFDVPEMQLSRYSDLSPYSIRIELSDAADAESLKILYVPKFDGLRSIIVPLKKIDNQEKSSPYDNQVLKVSGKVVYATMACSQLYSTYIISGGRHFKVSISTGAVDFKKSTPGGGGQKFVLDSRPFRDGSIVSFGKIHRCLICGYPTNFLKEKKYNYYHVYHVVSLMILADAKQVSERDKKTLLQWSAKWREYMNRELPEGLEFYDAQEILERTNQNLFKPKWSDYKRLVRYSSDVLKKLD